LDTPVFYGSLPSIPLSFSFATILTPESLIIHTYLLGHYHPGMEARCKVLSPRQCYHHKCAISFLSLRHTTLSTRNMQTNHRKL